MATEVVQLKRRRFGETMRRDAWWVEPLVVFLVLTGFVVYATWAALQNAHYEFGPYLSPFYSPLLFADSPHAWIQDRCCGANDPGRRLAVLDTMAHVLPRST